MIQSVQLAQAKATITVYDIGLDNNQVGYLYRMAVSIST